MTTKWGHCPTFDDRYGFALWCSGGNTILHAKKGNQVVCLPDRTWFPHNMFVVLTWDALVQAYEAYCTSTLPHPCPHCHRSRRYAGGHWRWVLWAAGTRRRFWLRHVRCETCHTLETLFPPWLCPMKNRRSWSYRRLGCGPVLRGDRGRVGRSMQTGSPARAICTKSVRPIGRCGCRRTAPRCSNIGLAAERILAFALSASRTPPYRTRGRSTLRHRDRHQT